MAASDPVVIVAAARSPLGRFQGELATLAGHTPGTHVIHAALDCAPVPVACDAQPPDGPKRSVS